MPDDRISDDEQRGDDGLLPDALRSVNPDDHPDEPSPATLDALIDAIAADADTDTVRERAARLRRDLRAATDVDAGQEHAGDGQENAGDGQENAGDAPGDGAGGPTGERDGGRDDE
ncbi:hypothetical protein [Halobaculum sp. D14]|uniref:hypothetical protein n=1 Tax=Halobaculum sp. D14 TaxID=3421642 RepID=UPI003EC0F1F9